MNITKDESKNIYVILLLYKTFKQVCTEQRLYYFPLEIELKMNNKTKTLLPGGASN